MNSNYFMKHTQRPIIIMAQVSIASINTKEFNKEVIIRNLTKEFIALEFMNIISEFTALKYINMELIAQKFMIIIMALIITQAFSKGARIAFAFIISFMAIIFQARKYQFLLHHPLNLSNPTNYISSLLTFF